MLKGIVAPSLTMSSSLVDITVVLQYLWGIDSRTPHPNPNTRILGCSSPLIGTPYSSSSDSANHSVWCKVGWILRCGPRGYEGWHYLLLSTRSLRMCFFWVLFCFLVLCCFFCLRKLSAELTSMPVLLYFVCGMPPRHGWWVEEVRAWDPNPQTRATKAERVELEPLGHGASPTWLSIFAKINR